MRDETPLNRGIPGFVDRAEVSIGSAASTLRFSDTRSKRVLRRFSIKEVCEFLGFERAFVTDWLDHPDGPKGEVSGRERLLSVEDIMRIRALAATRPKGRRPTLYWRKAGERLPVISVVAQKGGTGKSTVAAHLAQYAHLFYGLRVGVIDADPQASCSLYFADDQIAIASSENESFTTFMGVPAPGEEPLEHSDAQLDRFWRPTPWPGVRLMPGGAEIQGADIAMHFMARGQDKRFRRVYRLLRDTLARWDSINPPRTAAEEFFGANGRFREDVFQSALTETLDLVIIDTPPSLSLAALNAVIAADSLVIPQTMKGFDLSTLRIYLGSLGEYLRFVREEEEPVNFAPLPSYVLPSIVSTASDTDMRHVGELLARDPDVVCPIVLFRSEAVANAAEDYQSIYEYQAPKSRRVSAQSFTANANAVCDAMLTRAIPGLPSRGYANRFLRETYGDAVAPWTEETDR